WMLLLPMECGVADKTQIKVICFDLDDTLWPFEPVIRHANGTLHAWLEEHYPKTLEHYHFDNLPALRKQILDEKPELMNNVSEFRKAMLSLVAEAAGYSQDLVDPAFEVLLEARQKVTLYDDVLPALGRLGQSYHLCSITNGNAYVERTGLGDVFHHAIRAEQYGISKPDPRLFELVCDRFNVKSDEIAHVGDDPVTDVQGALNSGMTAIWINRDYKSWEDEHKPHAEIKDLYELESWLQD
ncbi:MAG: HAD family hydrolase, partial [Pseudomonadota bacterium]